MPGSYDNQVELARPAHMSGRKEGSASDTICIDKCLQQEIERLWQLGIRTTGCCCGHNQPAIPSFIGVIEEDIQRMKELGYKVCFNRMRPNDEDSFVPKSLKSN